MKVCFWATTFQSHSFALAHYLDSMPGHEVLVAMDHPEAFERAPVSRLLPPGFALCAREGPAALECMRNFAPDLLIVDNHLPKVRLAPRTMVLWHGFGWRQNNLSTMRRDLRLHVGRVTCPNPAFRWQAFGDWDRRYRAERGRLAVENVVVLGAAYSDLLVPGSQARRRFRPEEVAAAYDVDVAGRRTVLLVPTWHYGSFLGHWGDEASLLEALCAHARERDAVVVMRLHDRFRYPREYVEAIDVLSRRLGNLQCRYKDVTPDTLLDLLLADVVVSNYSSILADAYAARIPTVSVWPVPDNTRWTHRYLRRGKVRERRTRDASRLWKLPLEHSGGPIVRDLEALLRQIDRALESPDSFEADARAWLERYIHRPDGSTRARIVAYLEEWVSG